MSAIPKSASLRLQLLAAQGLYVHSIPGRLRLELPSLLGNAAQGDRLLRELTALAGVRAVHASPLTGRVLIQYDDRQLTPDRLMQALLHLEDSGSDPQASHGTANGVVGWALGEAVMAGVQLALGF